MGANRRLSFGDGDKKKMSGRSPDFKTPWQGRLRRKPTDKSSGAHDPSDTTSDYGTASETSRPSSTPDVLETSEVSDWDSPETERGLSVGAILLRAPCGVSALTPDGHWILQVVDAAELRPPPQPGKVQASPVVSLHPLPTENQCGAEAVLFLPFHPEQGPGDVLDVLRSSTEPDQTPRWRVMDRSRFSVASGKVIVWTDGASLFAVMMRPASVEYRRLIRRRSGGRIVDPSTPGLQITFPGGWLDEDVVASVRVLHHPTPELGEPALASPVIVVGPHGAQFRRPVTIRLPVPDYIAIRKQFSGRISVWQSDTCEDEAARWQPLDVDVVVRRDARRRIYTASFNVWHFSFFKIMWDLLSTSLFQAKMGMSHFYPYISFSMMCQAFMEQDADASRFGLEVICHRSDKRLPELSNYKHRVGASLKPKLMKPGRIVVRLKSQLFEADVEAGEDAGMLKAEPDFRGRDFDLQYACRFKSGVQVGRGTFGKVVVERAVPSCDTMEQLFEFNLHKTGAEAQQTAPECSDRWSVVAIKELAGTLRILDDHNWKTLARYIGFTRQEIKAKLQYSADPFLSMMNMYQARGGSPEEFLQALYAVSRELHISGPAGAASPAGSQLSGRSRESGGSSSHGGSSPCGSHNSSQDSGMGGHGANKRRLWALNSLAPWRATKHDDDSDTSGTRSSMHGPAAPVEPKTKGKTLSNKSSSKASAPKPAPKRPRRHYSDYSETVTSGSESSSAASSSSGTDDDDGPVVHGVRPPRRVVKRAVRRSKKATPTAPSAVDLDDDRSTEKCKRDPRNLTDGDLWRLSALMNKINWRALGRTLGLQESALVNVEASYRTAGCRECAYQMLLEWKGLKPKSCTVGHLFSALTKENMNEVAKEMAALPLGTAD